MADHTYTDATPSVIPSSDVNHIVDIAEVLLELGLSASDTDEERAIVSVAIGRAEGAVKRHLKYDPTRQSRTEYYPQLDVEFEPRRVYWEVEGSTAYQRRVAYSATSELQVQHLPIRSITSLAIDYDGRSDSKSGAFTDTKTEGTDFWPNYDGLDGDGNKICRDGIIRSEGIWPTTPGSVKLVYTSGYSDDELHGEIALVDASPIWSSVLAEACRRVRKAFIWKKKTGVGFLSGPIISEKLGDYSVTLDSAIAAQMFGGLWDLTSESMQSLNDFVNYSWSL